MSLRHEIHDQLLLGERVAEALWFENGPPYLRFGIIKLRAKRAGVA